MSALFLPLPGWHARIWLRAVTVWMGFRFAAAWMGILGFGVFLTVLMLVVVSAAVWIDAKRRGELLFLANLGCTPLPVVVNAALAALVIEVALEIGLAMAGAA